MAHYKRIQAVRIPLDVVVAQNTTLGIYTSGGVSEVRWSEYPVTGAVAVWTSGIILAKGLGSEKQSSDLRRGGAVATYDGYKVVVKNTSGNKTLFENLGINLVGRTIYRMEFVGTDADADSSELATLSTMVIQGETSNETEWILTVKSAHYKHNAQMGTTINNDADGGNYLDATDDANGKNVPITFGKLYSNPAKFIRTAGKQTTLTNSDNYALGTYFTPIDQAVFPVVANFCGCTTTGSNDITNVGCASRLAIGDVITVYTGFSDGANKTITGVSGMTVTVNGLAATSDAFTYIDFEHKANETDSPAPCYVILTGTDKVGTAGIPLVHNSTYGLMTDLLNKWLKVVEGTGVDAYRCIDEYQYIFTSGFGTVCGFTVSLATYFETNLVTSVDATVANNAWVSLVEIPFEFTADVWPMAGFLDDTGAADTQASNLFAYKSDTTFLERKKYSTDSNGDLIVSTTPQEVGFRRIAPYGYKATTASGKNALVIDVSLFDSDPSMLASYDMIALTDLSKFTESNLATYSMVGDRVGENLYALPGDIPYITAWDSDDIAPTVWHDKDDTTKLQLQSYITINKPMATSAYFYTVYEVLIPWQYLTQNYEEYALGLNCASVAGIPADSALYDFTEFNVFWRRFFGAHKTVLSVLNFTDAYSVAIPKAPIEDIPDFWYISTGRTIDRNRAFVFNNSTASNPTAIYGKSKFVFSGISTNDQIKSVYAVCIMIRTKKTVSGATTLYRQFDIKELNLICKMSASISNEIYAYCAGRLFDDTWGSRKTAANMITTPAEIIEHCERLGNWGTATIEPGLEYDSAALIKTTGEGSFDAANLLPSALIDTYGNFLPGFQLFEANEQWLQDVKALICREYSLLSYYDNNGYACLKTFDLEAPTESILFTDIKNTLPDLETPKVEDVYCQPTINYRYNSGSEKYDGQLIVSNITQTSWLAAYTIGFDNTTLRSDGRSDGQHVWELCRDAYLQYQQIEQVPTDWSDLRTVVDYDDAVAILKKKIEIMLYNRQPGVVVSYAKGRDYHVFQHVMFNHPHRTSGKTIECLIESVDKNKNSGGSGSVTVDLIFLQHPQDLIQNSESASTNYQDTYDTATITMQGEE